ncbi:hypothetical protein [Brevundimonas sp.]|uniref:hypothetical protein n=1 Tax=Brevundimonas sp. TaxID=1871086 RepID=UPI003F6F7D50
MTDTRLVPAPPRLQEITWLWRRCFSFGLAALILVLLAGIIWSLGHLTLGQGAVNALTGIAFALIALLFADMLVYVGGATTYELVQLAQAAKIDISLGKRGGQ